MKKLGLILILILSIPVCAFSQNFSIKVNSHNLGYDSLHLQCFDGKKDFVNQISVSYSSNAVLKQKKELEPGIYRILGDSTRLFDFLISTKKQQNFNVTIQDKEHIVFDNNVENNNNQEYTKKITDFQRRFDEINQTFEKAQRTMPQYMIQTLADTLIAKADRLMADELAYKQKVMQDNKGTLLASIVKLSIETPPAPRNYYQNELLLRQYFASHFFDNYPFDDERMLNTPMTVFKMKEFAASLYQIDAYGGDTIMNRILTKAQISPQTYYAFFDNFEKVIGTLTSPYWTEELFLVMLRNALNYKDLEYSRKVRYTTQLEIHSKNRVGSQVPNIKLKMSNGDTTSLYDIESEYLLLYFQNPDCPTCTEVRAKLAANENLNKAIESGRIKVLTVYFEKDEALWLRYLKEKSNPKYLHAWEYELKIENEKLFDLRIIPYMFLLDKYKKVIKKDILFNEIDDYLRTLKIIQ